jgi:hypothetical protein
MNLLLALLENMLLMILILFGGIVVHISPELNQNARSAFIVDFQVFLAALCIEFEHQLFRGAL